MPRGRVSQVGETQVNANGYHNTRTEAGWRLTHHLIAEEKLGRKLDTSKEHVRFIDGDRRNLQPENIVIVPRSTPSLKSRIALIEAKIAELEGQKRVLLAELAKQAVKTIV